MAHSSFVLNFVHLVVGDTIAPIEKKNYDSRFLRLGGVDWSQEMSGPGGPNGPGGPGNWGPGKDFFLRNCIF